MTEIVTLADDGRAYLVAGERYPRVTTVCQAFDSWAGIPADVLEAARDRGDAVHYACELFDHGVLDMDSLPEEIIGYVKAWQDFRAVTGFHPDVIEALVSHPTYRYAGRLDRVGRFARGLRRQRVTTGAALVDIKTGAPTPAWGPQTAAYAAAYRGEKIRARYCVQLSADGTWRLHALDEPSDLSVFLAALTVINFQRRHGLA